MRIIDKIHKLVLTIMSMSGLVPKHMTIIRIVLLIGSFVFSPFIFTKKSSLTTAIIYFTLTTLIYYSFIFFTLSGSGKNWRRKLIVKYGEEKAFISFETLLVIIFFHNATSMNFLSQNTSSIISVFNIPFIVFQIIGLLLFAFSNIIAIWSAQILSIPLYYWKDMFLGKKINTFVASGPYKIFKNPMYSIGRLQYYGLALFYGSVYGLLAALISQVLLYTFYYIIELPFVKRMYLS